MNLEDDVTHNGIRLYLALSFRQPSAEDPGGIDGDAELDKRSAGRDCTGIVGAESPAAPASGLDGEMR
jgi:hypothetical protein